MNAIEIEKPLSRNPLCLNFFITDIKTRSVDYRRYHNIVAINCLVVGFALSLLIELPNNRYNSSVSPVQM